MGVGTKTPESPGVSLAASRTPGQHPRKRDGYSFCCTKVRPPGKQRPTGLAEPASLRRPRATAARELPRCSPGRRPQCHCAEDARAEKDATPIRTQRPQTLARSGTFAPTSKRPWVHPHVRCHTFTGFGHGRAGLTCGPIDAAPMTEPTGHTDLNTTRRDPHPQADHEALVSRRRG